MSEQTSAIVSKVWGMCNPLRDDGVSYGDYLEQLTYLIFLKMSDEYSRPPYKLSLIHIFPTHCSLFRFSSSDSSASVTSCSVR